MNTRFDLAAPRNPSSAVCATTPLRFKDFSKNIFLSVLSYPIGFPPNGAQTRTDRPRKPMMACPQTYQRILQFHWLETEGVFLGGGEWGGFVISRQKVALDLLLDGRKIPGKCDVSDTYWVQMHEEQINRQTDKHSPLYIRLVFDRPIRF